jgi:predicted transcriptional regulator
MDLASVHMDPIHYPEAVAAVVRKRLDTTGITVRELAETASIPHTTLLRRMKPDAFGFTTRELAAVCQVLGTTPAAVYAEAEQAA